jgi:hypothetical protein
LEEERIANTELREKLERLSTEFSLSEERWKSEITDVRGRLEREQLSSKNLRTELTSEINVSYLLVMIRVDSRLWNRNWKF